MKIKTLKATVISMGILMTSNAIASEHYVSNDALNRAINETVAQNKTQTMNYNSNSMGYPVVKKTYKERIAENQALNRAAVQPTSIRENPSIDNYQNKTTIEKNNQEASIRNNQTGKESETLTVKRTIDSTPVYKQKSTIQPKQPKVEAEMNKSMQTNQTSLFTANQGDKLSKTLEGWAKQEGWSLYWGSENDFYLPTNITINGNIEDVFTKVGKSLKNEGIEFDIKLYRLNKTIVVK